MKYISLLFIILFITGCQHHTQTEPPTNIGGSLSGSGSSGGRKILFYQCPMDPQVTSQDPKAKCTVCGMRLGPVYEDTNAGGENLSVSENTLKLSSATASVIGIETFSVKKDTLKRTLRVAGLIADDETKHRVLSARVPGRIEKLYVNQVGIDVSKDQPLAEIYSPDVLTAQRLYLENFHIQQTGTGAVTASELATSREKLLAYGLEESDIKTLQETGKPKEKLEILAPFDGTVVSRNAFEGQYVKEDDGLFEIGDFSSLWFVFDAYEQDLPLLKINQKVDVTFTSLPNEMNTAPITFIDPNLNEQTRTAKVRVVLPNPNRRILNRQTANGTVNIESEETLLVPRSAVLYTRDKPVVYVDLGGGNYQLRSITLGKIGDEFSEVLSGIQEGDNVVSQAALLLDSQAQLMRIPYNEPEAKQSESPDLTQLSALNFQLSTPFTAAVLKITSALSSDKLDEYNEELPAALDELKNLPDEVRKHLQPFAEKLKTGKTLKEVRTPFEPFSNAVADIVRAQEKGNRQAFIFQCPMSPVLGTARWIQSQNDDVLNPFFGEEMLNCGSELE